MKNKKIKKLKAFTIVEALICFGLMGVIFAVTIPAFKTTQDYHKLYWRAFDTLLQASKNGYADFETYFQSSGMGCTCEIDTIEGCTKGAAECSSIKINHPSGSGSEGGYCWNPAVGSNGEITCWSKSVLKQLDNDLATPFLKHPGFLYGYKSVGNYDGTGTDESFCQLFVSRINLLDGTSKCQSFIKKVNNTYVSSVKNTNPEFLKAFCWKYKTNSKGEVKEEQCTGNDSIEPTFVTSNGQKFYMSKVVNANVTNSGLTDQYDRRQYRFVAVDLNGNMGPNSQYRTAVKYPDIVLFAITSDGSIVPFGLPEFSKNYISAYIEYPTSIYNATKGTNVPNSKLKSDSLTLVKARHSAWGATPGTIENVILGEYYMEAEPFSLTPKFYQNMRTCKNDNGIGSKNTSHSSNNVIYADPLYVELLDYFSRDSLTKLANSNEIDMRNVDTQYGCEDKTSNCKINFRHD